jgi:hypothetical protein
VIATSNSTKKLKERLLSRFAVIELKAYDSLEEFKRVSKEDGVAVSKEERLDVLKGNDLAEYIAEQVYASSDKPNIRDCVRLATLCQTEQDVLRLMRILKR